MWVRPNKAGRFIWSLLQVATEYCQKNTHERKHTVYNRIFDGLRDQSCPYQIPHGPSSSRSLYIIVHALPANMCFPRLITSSTRLLAVSLFAGSACTASPRRPAASCYAKTTVSFLVWRVLRASPYRVWRSVAVAVIRIVTSGLL